MKANGAMLNNRSKVILGSCTAATLAVTAFVIDGGPVIEDAGESQSDAPIRHPLPMPAGPGTGSGNPERLAAMSEPFAQQTAMRLDTDAAPHATIERATTADRRSMSAREIRRSSPQAQSIRETTGLESRGAAAERPLDIAPHLDTPPAVPAVELDTKFGHASRMAAKPIADETPIQLAADLRTAVEPSNPGYTPLRLPSPDGPVAVGREELALDTVALTASDRPGSPGIVPPDPDQDAEPEPHDSESIPLQVADMETVMVAAADAKVGKEAKSVEASSDQQRVATYRQELDDRERRAALGEEQLRHRQAGSDAERDLLAAAYPANERGRAKRDSNRFNDRSRSSNREMAAKAISAPVSTKTARGTLPLQVSDGELVSIRLADLISLFEHQMDRSLFVWLKTSAEASKFVTPDTLRDAGIEVEFNPSSQQLVLSVAQ